MSVEPAHVHAPFHGRASVSLESRCHKSEKILLGCDFDQAGRDHQAIVVIDVVEDLLLTTGGGRPSYTFARPEK